MKFTDGYWMVRKGLKLQNPVDVRDVRIGDGKITVWAATKPVRHKGDTLNATLLTIEFSSPLPDVIGVRMYRHIGGVNKGPAFELNRQNVAPDISEDRDSVRLSSGKLTVRIRKTDGWDVSFFFGDKRLTGSGPKAAAHIEAEATGRTYMREQLDLGVGEYVYGFGERFTPFVKNGQTIDIWNEDGGTASEQAYKNIPFYLSNKGYGVFVNHPEKVSYEVASEVVSKVQFSVPGEVLEYFVIGGETLKDVLDNYTKLTGKPALPPAWSFGLWLTTSFTTSYDEETVNHFVDGMAERDLPLSVFHFDCFWMKEYQWTDFEWDKDVFPDPEGLLKRLKARGLKISQWINPYIAQKSRLFEEGARNGYLLRRPDGSIWQWDMWQAGMGLVDFTNPEAVRWFQDELRRQLDMGVDCFKTDFGERIPTDVVYHDGSDPEKMHNYYTYLYNKAVFDVLVEKRGIGEAVLFARSATAGGQQFPVHWGGDNSANYDSMAETLRGGLSLGLSGFGFWSHDISGFERTAPPDIYKRWVAFGMLSSHSRLHGNESYRVPWLFDEEAVDVLRHFTKLKHRLMPYLYDKAVEATERGLPMMRAMVLEFADDPTCAFLDLQYMLGDKLLVAPIFNTEGEARVYVPAGRWTHLLSGEKVEGGNWHYDKYDYFGLPLYVRPNTLLAMGNRDDVPDYDYADGVVFHLFEPADGKRAEARVVGLDGREVSRSAASREGSVITVTHEGAAKPWSLVLRGISGVASVVGGTAEPAAEGVRIVPNEIGSTLRIVLKD